MLTDKEVADFLTGEKGEFNEEQLRMSLKEFFKRLNSLKPHEIKALLDYMPEATREMLFDEQAYTNRVLEEIKAIYEAEKPK